jgi:gamma-glutamyltranspeptidase/glutathione hydrolase
LSKDRSSSIEKVACAAAVAGTLALAGCGTSKPVGSVGHVTGFGGLVAGDEPRAVLYARDVLSAGGSAADAAVALYFTMAVTLPSTATLGGGGMCVVHSADKKTSEVLDFIPPPPASAGQVPAGVPANARGFYALHAKYGKLRWESLLGEAERLARLGTPLSRAFAVDLSKGGEVIARDPQGRQMFFKPDGAGFREGDPVFQYDLAATISKLRFNPGELYSPAGSNALAQAIRQAGGAVTAEEIRNFKPQWREPVAVKLGDETALFAPPPAVDSTVAAQLTRALWERWKGTEAEERPHLLAEAEAKAFAGRPQWMQPHGWSPEDPKELAAPKRVEPLLAAHKPDAHAPVGEAARPTEVQASAGFVVLDANSNAVACSVSPNGLFGNGRVAPGTGVVLAAVPGANSGPPPVTPMLVVNKNVQEARFGAVASGGVTAPTAMVQVFLGSERDDKKLSDAIAAPRVHHSAVPDAVFAEAGDRALDQEPLKKRGHQVAGVAMPSRVNAFHCESGSPSFKRCAVATDPRGNGVAVEVGKD